MSPDGPGSDAGEPTGPAHEPSAAGSLSSVLLDRAKRLHAACLASGLTVAVAESCTGGLVAAAITAVPGASEWFLGSAVTYANAAKVGILGVSAATLEAHGAVSSETAAEMAVGARRVFGADLATSVTGIAGPGGGSPGKPVGLTCMGLADRAGVATRSARWPGDRSAVREAAAAAALDWLIERASGVAGRT
jgi:PncC family amidohydrolase